VCRRNEDDVATWFAIVKDCGTCVTSAKESDNKNVMRDDCLDLLLAVADDHEPVLADDRRLYQKGRP
jgi:hypothetical protein